MKQLSQNSKFIHIFVAVGSTWTLNDDHIVTGIEEFTCRLYGVGPRVKQVGVAREIKVKNICGSNVDLRPGLSIDLSTFAPCRRVLAQHIKRVNFQVCIWRRALDHFPEIPSPLDHGYHVTEAGKLDFMKINTILAFFYSVVFVFLIHTWYLREGNVSCFSISMSYMIIADAAHSSYILCYIFRRGENYGTFYVVL